MDGSDVSKAENRTLNESRVLDHVFYTRGLKRVKVTALNSAGSKNVSIELLVEGEIIEC